MYFICTYQKLAVSLQYQNNTKQLKQNTMNYQEINIRGTRMCKVQFCEIEDYLIEKGIDANEAFDIMADEREFCYISNGFRVGLLNDVDFISKGEWHHYFVKQEDGSFSAKKLSFVNNK